MSEAEATKVEDSEAGNTADTVEALPEASGKLRVLARGLDLILITHVVIPAVLFFLRGIAGLFGNMSLVDGILSERAFLTMLVFIVWALVEAQCVALFGASPGKLFMGLRVVQKRNNVYPNVKQSYLRAFIVVGIVIFGTYALPLLMSMLLLYMVLSEKKVVYWDKWAHTRVISIKQVGSILIAISFVLILAEVGRRIWWFVDTSRTFF